MSFSPDFSGKDGPQACYVYYKATVYVRFENGNPCTTAHVKFDFFVIDADSVPEFCGYGNARIVLKTILRQRPNISLSIEKFPENKFGKVTL